MRLDALPQQVARVEVQAELQPVRKLLKQALRRIVVKGYLARMYLQRELHVVLLELVEYRRPQLYYLVAAVLYHLLRGLREGVQVAPDRGARESGDYLDAHLVGDDRRLLHRLNAPLPYCLRLVGQGRGRKVVQPRVRRVAYALPDDVSRQRLADEPVLLKLLLHPGDVALVRQRTVEIQIVAPAGDLQAVIAHAPGKLAQLVERKVCPLAGRNIYNHSVIHKEKPALL